MSPAEQAADKIYARPPHFVVHYSAGRRLRWSSTARADYAVLLLLEGRLRWHSTPNDSESPGESDSVKFGPRAESDSTVKSGSASLVKSGSASSAKSGSIVESGEIYEGSALLAAPGDVLHAASATSARLLIVTLSPVFVLDCAARARLTRSDTFATFPAHAVERDERLARLARDLAEELLEEAAGQ